MSNDFLKYCVADGDSLRPLNNSVYFNENRQNLPKTYAPVGSIYIFTASEFNKCSGFPTQKMGFIEIEAMRSIDVDDPTSFDLAVEYMEANKSLFKV